MTSDSEKTKKERGRAPSKASGKADLRSLVVHLVAAALTVLWGAFIMYCSQALSAWAPEFADRLETQMMTAAALFLPLAPIWWAALATGAARRHEREAARLREANEALRGGQASRPAATPEQGERDSTDETERLREEAEESDAAEAGAEESDAAEAEAEAKDDEGDDDGVDDGDGDGEDGAPPSAQDDGVQAATATGAADFSPPEEPRLQAPREEFDGEPISVHEFIRAMNFPEDEHDQEGFRAMRAAKSDPRLEHLIRAAEELLTVFAHDGIYVDDLALSPARAEVWRRFANGLRGRAVSALAGIQDRPALELVSNRVGSDQAFHDTAHDFLRQFDQTFQEFEKTATDEEIARLAETRTARAFMLIGRVTGTFD